MAHLPPHPLGNSASNGNTMLIAALCICVTSKLSWLSVGNV